MSNQPNYAIVYCSQCGGEFPDAKGGLSYCENHAGMLDHSRVDAAMARSKMHDPYNQAGADRITALEVQLRAAAGMVA